MTIISYAHFPHFYKSNSHNNTDAVTPVSETNNIKITQVEMSYQYIE